MATYAPSVHNTQPWRFVSTPGGLQLEMDEFRQLTVLDPQRRLLLTSCGAACHHLQVAARGLGLDVETVLLPADAPDVVARFELTRGQPAQAADAEAAVAILHRHTHRGRFTDTSVPDGVLGALRTAVEGQGAMLRVVHPEELVEVQVLASQADRSLRGRAEYGDELARWVWHTEPHDDGPSDGPSDGPGDTRADGMPPDAVAPGTGRAEEVPGRDFGTGVAPTRPGPDDLPEAEHPTIVVLTTAGDSEADWVRAGLALSALLLTATNHELLAQPIGQVTDVPRTRWALQAVLGAVGAPQMVLRLGFGVGSPTSPRRPVSDVWRAEPAVG